MGVRDPARASISKETRAMKIALYPIGRWPPAYFFIAGLALLLAGRAVIQLLLYRAGFEALVADDFARTVLAARWAQAPFLLWRGNWLPFHTYLYGTALRLAWDLVWVPRFLSLAFGAASIVLMAQVGAVLFDNRLAGLTAGILLAANPTHIWLSATPLTEIAYTSLVLGCALCLICYLKAGQLRLLLASALLLALANGFHYESWLASVIFSLCLGGIAALQASRRITSRRQVLLTIGAAGLPWALPAAWVIGNYQASGEWFSFLTAIQAYKLAWYGPAHSLGYYWETFLKIDPYGLVLGILALVVLALGPALAALRRRVWPAQPLPAFFYASFGIAPFLLFALLHQGQYEPSNNFFRYLAPYSFMFYPLAAWLVVTGIYRLLHTGAARAVSLAAILALIVVAQVRTAFRFRADPHARGLAVGLRLRALREQNPAYAGRPALLEVHYWEYLAVLVGADDITTIAYDRQPDIERRSTPSLFRETTSRVQDCLTSNGVGYLVVKSAHARRLAEQTLQLIPTDQVNGYVFYQVPEESFSRPLLGQVECILPGESRRLTAGSAP